jgi:CRP-like cAMP-binding protein/Fe-S-cluster-containing hydrogenase component 2
MPTMTDSPAGSPGALVPVEELACMDLFAGVSAQLLADNVGAVLRRHCRGGELICREGAPGASAFYVERGAVRLTLEAPRKHVRSRAGKPQLFGLVRPVVTELASRADAPREEEEARRFIPIDAPVTLAYEDPTAVLEAGQLFGAMTGLNSYPRAATARAEGDVALLEIGRPVLDALLRSPRSRAVLDKVYREKGLLSLLRGVPIFSGVDGEDPALAGFLDYLKDRVELRRLEPGTVLFTQGDPVDGFYVVRSGFVKVSQRRPGGDHVLAYVGPGGHFGEIGLLFDVAEVQELIRRLYPEATRPVRTATCSAVDYVELVRIAAEDFYLLFDYTPQVAERLLQTAVQHLRDHDRVVRQAADVPLGEFLEQGLAGAPGLVVLDLEKCTRCGECTRACGDDHDGITRLIREGMRFDRFLLATSCRACLGPSCMVGCPVGAVRRRTTREILIEDWCIGCGLCVANCPYGNLALHPFADGGPVRKATTCDLCADLSGTPSCVYACPHEAAHRLTGRELLERARPRS